MSRIEDLKTLRLMLLQLSRDTEWVIKFAGAAGLSEREINEAVLRALGQAETAIVLTERMIRSLERDETKQPDGGTCGRE